MNGKGKKTKAKYQREYRERKKQQNNEEYLKNERERKRDSYTLSKDLPKRELQRRRKYDRERMRNYRENHNSPVSVPSFPKRIASRKRISRATSRANRKIENLENQLQAANRTIWKLQKREQRLPHTSSANKNKTPKIHHPTTPKSKTDLLMRRSGLEPNKYKSIRRKLVFHNSLIAEINEFEPYYRKRITSGKIVKKYRMLAEASREVAVRRRSLITTSKDLTRRSRQRNKKYKDKLKKNVLQFLERGDNSSLLPGKADYKTQNKKQSQKRILSDHLKHLFSKYQAENPIYKLSYPSFCRLRPAHFSFVSYTTRSACLCIKHQNMALKLRCLHKDKIVHTDQPDEYVKNVSDDFDASTLLPQNKEKYEFQQWARVNTDTGQRVNCVNKSLDRQNFVKQFTKEVFEFRDHVQRIKEQYRALQNLKQNLPDNHVIAQMDFSENYNCKSVEEVQSSYFNKCMVTLHPIVVYYKRNGTLCHKNFTFISNDLCHNASAVFGIIKKLISAVQLMISNLKYVHYWTDGPTSQYRNKHIFSLMAKHSEYFGTDASWDYFEAGHGKGPCDGIGGIVKRSADLAIKQKKAVIQNADNFYEWASSSNLAVTFKYISKDEIERNSIVLNSTIAANVKPVKGTLKLHAVRSLPDKTLLIRDTSCYCKDCMIEPTCPGWHTVKLWK